MSRTDRWLAFGKNLVLVVLVVDESTKNSSATLVLMKLIAVVGCSCESCNLDHDWDPCELVEGDCIQSLKRTRLHHQVPLLDFAQSDRMTMVTDAVGVGVGVGVGYGFDAGVDVVTVNLSVRKAMAGRESSADVGGREGLLTLS